MKMNVCFGRMVPLMMSAGILLLAGCSEGSGVHPTSSQALTLSNFQHAYARALCDVEERCDLGFLPGGNDGFCITAANDLVSVTIPEGSVHDGTVLFDGDAASKCTEMLGQMECYEAFEMLTDPASSEAVVCNSIFLGTGQEGDECQSRFECGGGMTCVSDGCMGACVALHGPGCSSGPLDDADIPCAFGDFCLDGACVPQYEQGHACDADWQCVWGLVCVDGVCSSGALSGQRCDPQHICARGLFCQTDGICYQPTLGAAVGESCGATTFCTSGAWCDWSSTKCVERILEGDKCNSSSECLIGFSCTGEPEQMVCTKRRAVAQPCAKPLDCFSGICTDGLCASIDVNSCQ